MIFNSLEFAVFALIVMTLYWGFARFRRVQNTMLLVASYFFYGWWDWRFLSLIALSTIVDYFVGLKLESTDDAKKRRYLLWVSLGTNLGILGFFKYFNFFAESTVTLLNSIGLQADAVTLNVVLPVGISFYTFQTLSYSIDIYRGRLKATRSLLDFSLFVAFFPQLVAGPIERASALLPQIQARRKITANQINDGLFLILWGLFKKVVIADNVALIANEIFNQHTQYDGLDLMVGALAFTVQIYGDFSGYSDIARGLSKLMGFDLIVNFKLPYVSRTPSEFWQRWHISLSGWLRDYLYISLGGNRNGPNKTLRNLMLTMLLGGLWHGAAWNFIYWGAFHGGILIVYRLAYPKPLSDGAKGLPMVLIYLAEWAVMFVLVVVGWVLFRASNHGQIIHFLSDMWWGTSSQTAERFTDVLLYASPLLVMQAIQFVRHDLLAVAKLWLPLRVTVYSGFILTMMVYGVRKGSEFIYFQF